MTWETLWGLPARSAPLTPERAALVAGWRAYALSLPDDEGRHCAGACGYAESLHVPGSVLGHPFRPPPEPDTTPYQEVVRRDAQAARAAIEEARRPYEPKVTPPPRIPARAPEGPTELASYQRKQAAGIGRLAVAMGWSARAWYWMAHDGTEGCAVAVAGGGSRAVLTWKRKAGNAGKTSGWSADSAYAWLDGQFPHAVGHKDLEKFFTSKGETQ